MVNEIWWKWDSAVDVDFCDYVIKAANWNNASLGTYSSDAGYASDPCVRKTDVVFVDQLAPVSSTLQNFILLANKRAGWNYDITGFQDTQLGRYVEEGHYDWHADTNGTDTDDGLQRKLTAVLLLNSPENFKGGDLEIDPKNPRTPIKDVGGLVVFPSFLVHRVTPVLSGVRYTAVCWAIGPTFR